MPNRYEGQFNIPLAKGPSAMDRSEAERKRKEKQQLMMLASIGMPMVGAGAGAALGSLAGPGGAAAGMAAGGQLGSGAGQAAGQFFANEGESGSDELRRREMERMALMQAIQGMRGYG